MKTCTKCGVARSLDQFAIARRTADGRHSWCKPCASAAMKAYRQAHPERAKEVRVRHRLNNVERLIWRDMIRRCTNPKRADFRHYGGRGISVCKAWLDSFEAFMSDVGPRPTPKHSIDRIDNAKGYEPGNCRWATQKEQLQHFGRTRLITANGQTMTLTAWSERMGATPRLIQQRLDKLGWTPEQAVTLAPGARRAA